ncbi:DUF6516 family protein [Calidifontimicrobium sp. SYSU G02091]|uniref:toxin-antitoxin system TumE family protein n=1 Tax=Calidifontimicrobium sp. SYSU G02091 TaxID=2926421 RepID=UPI001F531301|nr:DUF6516 family protein [Calidifontimicrobium sp. SYSU G02091]MCI1191263.1 DUF6516 family protein [Calidifontimicrobium sp. SYSU G02091]
MGITGSKGVECWIDCQHLCVLASFLSMMASPLIRRRVVMAADAFVEVVVWRVRKPVPPAAHPFKYRLAYVVRGQCVLRYDSERGKGGHRHIGNVESAYAFTTPEQLMVDFESEVKRWNREHGRT